MKVTKVLFAPLMRTNSLAIKACRHCQHYATEGRRGGQCRQLSVPVQGGWKACSLAIPPFAPSWATVEETASDNVTAIPVVLAGCGKPIQAIGIAADPFSLDVLDSTSPKPSLVQSSRMSA